MYFTKTQRKALIFLVVVFALSIGYHFLQRLVNPKESFDFTQFEEKFFNLLDTVRTYSRAESLQTRNLNPDALPAVSTSQARVIKQKVNVNTASIADLMTLPRIGPKIAQRIVEYRQAHGPFTKRSDIMQVKGIGRKTYDLLKDLIVVE